MGGRMSEEARVGDGTLEGPEASVEAAAEASEDRCEADSEGRVRSSEVVPEAEVVEEEGQEFPEPDDEDLSPWYGDLDEDDGRDLPPDDEPRRSLYVPPLEDEGVPVFRPPRPSRPKSRRPCPG